jgi:hypothetical protein
MKALLQNRRRVGGAPTLNVPLGGAESRAAPISWLDHPGWSRFIHRTFVGVCPEIMGETSWPEIQTALEMPRFSVHCRHGLNCPDMPP